MEVLINGVAYTIAEIEIALRYAVGDTTDADAGAALLIAAAALAGVTEANGA